MSQPTSNQPGQNAHAPSPNFWGRLSLVFRENVHLLALTVITVLIAGFFAFQAIPRQEDPVITTRNTLVITLFPGASAERVEALVTEHIEEELDEIDEIKHIDSTSRAGVSVVSVELMDAVTRETNQAIFSEMRDKVDQAAAQFPPGVLPPVFDEQRGAVAYTLIVGLTWTGDDPANLPILHRLAETLADRLRTVGGTEIVRLFGNPQEEITLTLDHAEQALLGMSPGQVASLLNQADAKTPAGIVRGPEANLLAEVEGRLDSLDRIAAIPLLEGEGETVRRLGDIAEIERGYRYPPSEIAYNNGQRTILVAARVRPSERVDRWSERALGKVEAFQQDLGEGVSADVIFEQNQYTSDRLGQLAFNLMLGAVVVMMVVFLSMGWRSSLLVGSALPLTAALTLFIVAAQGGKLHQMSIFGMIIALGLLIDNAIVIVDDIRRRRREGLTDAQATGGAVSHLFIPLLSSTLTTVLAFMPILLLPGNAGDFVSSIGGSVVIAIVSSFFVAMFVVAALAGHLGRASPWEHRRLPAWLRQGITIGFCAGGLKRAIHFALRRPIGAILASCIVPVCGFLAASTLGSQFFPRVDRDMFGLEIWLPNETSITQTARLAREVEDVVKSHEGVREVFINVGNTFPSVYYNLIVNEDNSPFYANAIITATGPETVKRLIPTLQQDLDQRFPQAQIVVKQFAQGPPAEADVEFRISGPSISVLQQLGEQVRLALAEHPGILHASRSMPAGEPKVWLAADESTTKLAGFELTDLADQLEGYLEGFQGGSILEEQEEIPVRVRLTNQDRASVENVSRLNFVARRPDGSPYWVPLAALGQLEVRPELGGITRRDNERVHIIEGLARNDALPIEIGRDVIAKLKADGFSLPEGYTFKQGGDQENQAEAVQNLALYLPVLVIVTVSILVLSFRSVLLAGILLAAAFLSTGYGLLSTWAYGLPFSFNTILGCLGLIGLAFNASIVVLAAIRANPRARAGDTSAMAEEIMATSRHLTSTTLTTIGGFLPLLIFVGGDFWPPLAIVLAGGVGGSTLLALIFTPAALALAQRFRRQPPAVHPV